MVNKIKVRFEGKVWKTGCSHVITIPNTYIKFGMVNIKKKQTVYLEEMKVKGSSK